jgi:hypothetical protein
MCDANASSSEGESLWRQDIQAFQKRQQIAKIKPQPGARELDAAGSAVKVQRQNLLLAE